MVELGRQAALTLLHPIDLHIGHGMIERFAIRPDAPLSASAEVEPRIHCRRADWSVRVHSRVAMRSDAEQFHLQAELEALEGEVRGFHRRWTRKVPRFFV